MFFSFLEVGDFPGYLEWTELTSEVGNGVDLPTLEGSQNHRPGLNE